MAETEVLRTDVIVVGAGLAGSLAALAADETGARITMVLKGGNQRGPRTGTAVAGGGIAAAFGHADPNDNPFEHLRDTLRGGEFLNDQCLARLMVEKAPAGIRQMESLGVEFERDGDRYRQRQAPGHSYPRSVMTPGARMGQLLKVLTQRVKESACEVRVGLSLVDILVDEGRARGVTCLSKDGSRVDILATSVILATGGLGQLYPVTSNPPFATGDGYACAYRAGARLRDMEFVQFTPAGLIYPENLRGRSVSHDLLALPQARVFNGRMEDLTSLGPGAARDMTFRLDLIRRFHREIHEGHATPHGGVYLDVREVSREQAAGLAPGLWEALANAGVDAGNDLLEIAPEVHFFMGGVEVDESGQSTLPGLFVVGEVAGGCHGANRLTHNAFPETIVYAPRAGRAAGERSPGLRGDRAPTSLATGTADFRPWSSALDLRERLRATMLSAAGPRRTEEGLSAGLATLHDLREAWSERRATDPHDLLAGLSTRNLFLVAEMILRSAQFRQETRGSHYRVDRPDRDDREWLVNTFVTKGPSEPNLQVRPVELAYLRPEG
ncbi:MAG: FAD-binding protein [Chloroflexota bacterium]